MSECRASLYWGYALIENVADLVTGGVIKKKCNWYSLVVVGKTQGSMMHESPEDRNICGILDC